MNIQEIKDIVQEGLGSIITDDGSHEHTNNESNYIAKKIELYKQNGYVIEGELKEIVAQENKEYFAFLQECAED